MMNADAVKAIADLAPRPDFVEDKWPDGSPRPRLLCPPGWNLPARNLPTPDVLQVPTLQAFADYVQANRDELDLEHLVAYIRGPGSVALLGPLESPRADFMRHGYCHAALNMDPHPFGDSLALEEFLVWLLARFIDDHARQVALDLVGGIRDSNVRETTDDGYAQKVTSSAGVVACTERRVDNPHLLTPRRTFPEVAQPPSPFILRFRRRRETDGDDTLPSAALFEADGGAWRVEAAESIRQWLRAALPSSVAVIG